MNKQVFFDSIRASLFKGKLSQSQVNGFNFLLDEWERRGYTDLRWLAYVLATAFHETAMTMQPIEEYGKGKGHDYGKPVAETGKAYYGRGYCQLTWIGNYKRFGRLLNLPLAEHPELALQADVAAKILYEGMVDGLFTGRKLADYFNADKTDWVNARRIINILDCAVLISGYAKHFYEALTLP